MIALYPGRHDFVVSQVEEVRTADDALMRVKLMIFYEVKDIDRMVKTHFINTLFDNGPCLIKARIRRIFYMDVFLRSSLFVSCCY